MIALKCAARIDDDQVTGVQDVDVLGDDEVGGVQDVLGVECGH